MRVSVIKQDGMIEEEEAIDVGVVGQAMQPGPELPTPIKMRFPVAPIQVFPLVARYPHPLPYVAQPRSKFSQRFTMFVKAYSAAKEFVGWAPIAIVEVDNAATALAIARALDGAIGPAGAAKPTEFP